VTPPHSVTEATTLYPCSIDVIGHPASHGTADLLIDTNDVAITRVVLTADLIVSLHRALTDKRTRLHLVTEEVSE
jgi:hypothetical protein